MGSEDLDSVAKNMTLASGYVWSIPILLDVSQVTINQLAIAVGDAILLTYQQQPLALMDIQEYITTTNIFCANKFTVQMILPIRELNALTRTMSILLLAPLHL